MSTRTNHNRYRHIMMCVNALGEYGDETATQLSKRVNLSRQAILDILHQAETWGYVYSKKSPYRYRKDGTVLVYAYLWYPTEYGLQNSGWFVRAWNSAANKIGKQLPLL